MIDQRDRKQISQNDRRVSSGIAGAKAVALDRENENAFMMEDEPSQITADSFRYILVSAVLSGASDITIQSDQQPRAEINGDLYRMTRRVWSPSEVDMVLMEVYGSPSSRTEINASKVLDFSYQINMAAGKKQRFRVNATGIFGRDGGGVEITMRVLPAMTPTLDMVGLNLEEAEALSPRDGLVVIAGGTGSGKSTTQAAILRHHLEDRSRSRKIVDFQMPIEYTFLDVTDKNEGSASLLGQSEVGKHVKTFALGVHSALRRKPGIIVIGESRDFETISASLEASNTGHLAYTTTHAGSVSEAIRRLLSTFPGDERESMAYSLISSLRFIMVQHLVRRIDKPGRIAVREYLKFTDRIRLRLVNNPISEWPTIIAEEVDGKGPGRDDDDMSMSLSDVSRDLMKDGIISEIDAKLLMRTVSIKLDDITEKLGDA